MPPTTFCLVSDSEVKYEATYFVVTGNIIMNIIVHPTRKVIGATLVPSTRCVARMAL